MYFKNRKHISCRGFTLIELLVVISIIAVLMAIMMPALRAAKAQAYKAVCAARLRSVSQGPLLFAADNDGWLPMTDGSTLGNLNAGNGCQECLSWGRVYPQRQMWYRDVAPYLGVGDDPYVKQNFFAAEKAGIDAPKIYQCPSMKNTVYGVRGLAYGWNWSALGYKCKDYFAGGVKYWGPVRVSQINSGHITGMIGENPLGHDPENEKTLYRHFWGGAIWKGFTGGREGFYFYGDRHSGGSHYIPVDGHVEFRTYEEYVLDFREYHKTNRGGGIIYPNPRRWTSATPH